MSKVICTKGKLVIEVEGVQCASTETGIPPAYIKHLIQTGNEKNGWTFDYAIETKRKPVPRLTINQFKLQ